MTKISVTDRDGAVAEMEASPGETLMRALKFDGGFDISADCGGNAICGTCHVYFDAASAARVSPSAEHERELLDQFVHVRPHSRLACQVLITHAIESLAVTIAPRE